MPLSRPYVQYSRLEPDCVMQPEGGGEGVIRLVLGLPAATVVLGVLAARDPVAAGLLVPVVQALLLAAPTREMDSDVGDNLDRRWQGLHDPAVNLLLL